MQSSNIESTQYRKKRVCPVCKADEDSAEFTRAAKRCRSCEKQYHADWYAKNKEREKKRVTEWQMSNPDLVKSYQKKSRAKNKGKVAARGKRWRDENKELMASLKRIWRGQNPEKDAEYNHKRRCRGGNASAESIRLIMDRDGRKCLKCGSEDNLSIDHVVPVSKGGSNNTDNLQTLCLPCNLAKHTKIEDYRKNYDTLAV